MWYKGRKEELINEQLKIEETLKCEQDYELITLNEAINNNDELEVTRSKGRLYEIHLELSDVSDELARLYKRYP